MKKTESINFKNDLQNDNVFVNSELKSLAEITGMPTRKGLTKALISEGTIVNIVSDAYGHMANEKFFTAIEEKLIEADINYVTRSINRNNQSFAVDYILNDENYIVDIKNGMDKLRPMLRFTNAYDGSCKTSGHFGFFREVCSNGLHVAHSQIGFSVKHTNSIGSIVLPRIKDLVVKFMDNEFYALKKKFELLSNTPIVDVDGFIRDTATAMKFFKYESSEKNPLPGLSARLVKETIERESNLLQRNADLWIGYNAFNEILHSKIKQPFGRQQDWDAKVFDHVLSLAN